MKGTKVIHSARSLTSPHRAPISSHRMTSARSTWSPTSPHRAPTSSPRMASVGVFHDVLRVFHDVLLVVHDVLRCITMFCDVSQCFTCVSWYFIMFNNVLWCLASRATNRGATSAAADRLRDRGNVAVIGDNSKEIGDDAAGIVDIAANVIPC